MPFWHTPHLVFVGNEMCVSLTNDKHSVPTELKKGGMTFIYKHIVPTGLSISTLSALGRIRLWYSAGFDSISVHLHLSNRHNCGARRPRPTMCVGFWVRNRRCIVRFANCPEYIILFIKLTLTVTL